jgi:hypothetical protein
MSLEVSAIEEEVPAVTAVTATNYVGTAAPAVQGKEAPLVASSRHERGRSCSTTLPQHLLGSLLTRAHAIGYANPAISISRQSEAWQLLQQALDSLHPFEVTHNVLRHRPRPSVYASEDRFRMQAENLSKFFAHDAEDFVVGKVQDRLVARTPEKARWENLWCTKVAASMRLPSLRGTRKPKPAGNAARTSLSNPRATVMEELYGMALSSDASCAEVISNSGAAAVAEVATITASN